MLEMTFDNWVHIKSRSAYSAVEPEFSHTSLNKRRLDLDHQGACMCLATKTMWYIAPPTAFILSYNMGSSAVESSGCQRTGRLNKTVAGARFYRHSPLRFPCSETSSSRAVLSSRKARSNFGTEMPRPLRSASSHGRPIL
jgi:hypothetical protein